jgi:3-oxoacyl-[acyl-carrier protein] reductase
MSDEIFMNKVAIVTGASRGIGRAIALELAQAGAKVAFTYLKNDEQAKSLLLEIEKIGLQALSFKGDVRNFDLCREFVEQVKSYFGGLDFLVNNAGITRDKAFMLMEKNDWQEVIDTNLTGYFNMCRSAIVTFLKQKSGNIVNISSISGISGIARQVNYSAAKAGIIGLTKALAKEAAPYNIRVNCVAPGFIETDMTAELKEDVKEKFIKFIPFGRFGNPLDVAKAVLFLLSDRSNYLTGQVIKVDGGLHTAN